VDAFPYGVVYFVHGDELLIVAFAHQSRRPGCWRNQDGDWVRSRGGIMGRSGCSSGCRRWGFSGSHIVHVYSLAQWLRSAAASGGRCVRITSRTVSTSTPKYW